jgi:hypothetical protein
MNSSGNRERRQAINWAAMSPYPAQPKVVAPPPALPLSRNRALSAFFGILSSAQHAGTRTMAVAAAQLEG